MLTLLPLLLAFGTPLGPGGPPTKSIPVLSGENGGGVVDLDLDLYASGIVVHRSTDEHGIPSNGLIVAITTIATGDWARSSGGTFLSRRST